MQTRKLAFEIGTEEIPAFDLDKATKQLSGLMQTSLDDAGISYENIEIYSSPRRLIAIVDGVCESTEAIDESMKGPSKKIAFDDDGSPTKAAIGFAKGKGIDVSELEVREDGGVEYVFANIHIPSKNTTDLLPDILLGVIDSLSWPKSMRWATYRELFTRPVRWIVALFGSDVVKFDYAGITSGNETYGHRFLSPGPHKVDTANNLISVVESSYVIPTQQLRQDAIIAGVDRIVASIGAGFEAKLPDKTLLEVTNLSEYPTPMLGKFDESFLQVPEEIIVDAMLMHQRYFPIYKDEKLTNNFIIVSNGDPEHEDIIVDGNQRVVAARLYDAKFFYDEDQKIPFDEYVNRLDEVVFQEKLGDMHSKTMRIQKLAEKICIDAELSEEEAVDANRAAYLCKADLVTNAVIEFTSVQGVMGSYYSSASGENDVVSKAIADHYKPRFAGDDVPSNIIGKVVALSDKLDTICGLFSIDQGPTGSSDPFGLRRAAIGIIAILQSGLDISLESAIEESLRVYKSLGASFDEDAVTKSVIDFFIGRTKVMLRDEGNSADVVEAVLACDVKEPLEIIKRTRALSAARNEQPELFEDLAIAYARANNLRDKDAGIDVDASLFSQDEINLSTAIEEVSTQVAEALDIDDYALALSKLGSLRAPIDDFFESTMIMDDDLAIRANHMKLLNRFVDVFTSVADFSKLAGTK